jgi:hypothetical protein
MTPESIVTLIEPSPETVSARRRRVNGWELALWILGAVLIAGAIILLNVVAKVLYFPNGNEVGGTEAFALIQASTVVIPGCVTAGFISILLAIAIRAMELNAWRREDRTRAAVSSVPIARSEAVPSEPAPSATAAPATVPTVAPTLAEPKSVPSAAGNTDSGDYRLFMRPPAEKSD